MLAIEVLGREAGPSTVSTPSGSPIGVSNRLPFARTGNGSPWPAFRLEQERPPKICAVSGGRRDAIASLVGADSSIRHVTRVQRVVVKTPPALEHRPLAKLVGGGDARHPHRLAFPARPSCPASVANSEPPRTLISAASPAVFATPLATYAASAACEIDVIASGSKPTSMRSSFSRMPSWYSKRRPALSVRLRPCARCPERTCRSSGCRETRRLIVNLDRRRNAQHERREAQPEVARRLPRLVAGLPRVVAREGQGADVAAARAATHRLANVDSARSVCEPRTCVTLNCPCTFVVVSLWRLTSFDMLIAVDVHARHLAGALRCAKLIHVARQAEIGRLVFVSSWFLSSV